MQILTRPAKPGDMNFVYDSWMKSWRVSKWAGVIPNHLYYACQRNLIEDLIARGAEIVVACPDSQPDVILGWACGEVKDGATVLHYSYTKDPYLGLGIESTVIGALSGSKPGFITHKINSKYCKEWKHVPEMCRRKDL